MTDKEFVALHERISAKCSSQRAIAAEMGLPVSTLRSRLERIARGAFSLGQAVTVKKVKVPKRGVKRYIFTSVQDSTPLDMPFWNNLLAYAKYRKASLHVASFTYNKKLFEENRKDAQHQWYPPEVRPYLSNEQIHIGDKVIFCGEMNTLPTAIQPLHGFETYTRDKWGIFPHAKIQLVSVPNGKFEETKQIMTTGAATVPNYVQRRAGLRAQFHHAIGAVLLEIDEEGDIFCRHLVADNDGNFQDLTTAVIGGEIIEDVAVGAVTWGDIHHEKLEDVVADACWGDGGMLDQLAPAKQFFHDIIDFKVRNHHNLKDPHFMFKMWMKGTESIEGSLKNVLDFMRRADRPYCDSIVVESNHDLALGKWLKEHDWREDPVNAEFYLRTSLRVLQQIKRGEVAKILRDCLLYLEDRRHLSRDTTGEPSPAREWTWLEQSESYIFTGIECGMHGHLGGNGARGNPRQFARMGHRANTGHTHSPGITDGIFTAGVSGSLDMGYNEGMSSWARTHIVTYDNGRRTLVTMQGSKFRAY